MAFAMLERQFPGRSADNTDQRQMEALLSQVPRILEIEASYSSAALGNLLTRVLPK